MSLSEFGKLTWITGDIKEDKVVLSFRIRFSFFAIGMTSPTTEETSSNNISNIIIAPYPYIVAYAGWLRTKFQTTIL